ncbi:hypothetical protein HYU16_04550 [Candidatus Woesearchaeota archaeon]|nr:hypothetical protein [Candidatus Woesearchaeota archaeon]
MKLVYLTQFPAELQRPDGSSVGLMKLESQILKQISGGYGRVKLLAHFVLPDVQNAAGNEPGNEQIQPFPVILEPSPNGSGYELLNPTGRLVLEDLLRIASNNGLDHVTVVVHKQYLEKSR